MDSGASGTVIDYAKARHFGIFQKSDTHILTTVMGTVENNKSALITFKLPEFSPTLELEWECDVLDDMSNTPYDMIIC